MIDPNKCSTCYPIVAKIFEMKFEGEKTPKQVILRSWRECDKPAVSHITNYVDPNKPTTMFVMHRCADHAKPEQKIETPAIFDTCFP